MTRYDPFAHGQVNLDAGKTAPPQNEDDMLFAGGETVKQAAPADSSWELLKEDVADLLPNARAPGESEVFGADILGEAVPASSGPGSSQRRPESTAPRPKSPRKSQEKKQTSSPRDAQAAAPRVGARMAAPPVEGSPPSESRGNSPFAARVQGLPARHGSADSRRITPLVLLGVGGTAATWLGLVRENLVLAAIVGCLTLVAVAFAYLWLRD